MAGEWTLPGIGDDLMTSARFGERRLKVESSLISGESQEQSVAKAMFKDGKSKKKKKKGK